MDAAYEIFSRLPVMQKFSETYNVRPLYGSRYMLDVLLHSYEEYLGRKPDTVPQIAIVDLGERPTQSEFELFKEFFEREDTRLLSVRRRSLNLITTRCAPANFRLILSTSVCW